MEGTAGSVSHRDAWLVCTPSKLVLLLFVLEIALMLRGFQSGWLALLGILAFVLAILGLVAWFLVATYLKRKFQFSLLSLLGLMLCSALTCSWFSWKLHKAKRHEELVERCERLGVGYTYSPCPSAPFQLRPRENTFLFPPQCLQRLFGFHFFIEMNSVRSRLDVGNEDLRLLADFESIERLSLVGTQVTNAAVPHLKQFTRLRVLDVSGTEITAEGIAELQKALPKCTIIHGEVAHLDSGRIIE